MKINIPERIQRLRQVMQAQRVDAWLVFTADPHMSEYLPSHWQQREYLSGFTGSAGLMAVTQHSAALWTDSRYWEQAEHELSDSGIALMRQGTTQTPSLAQWLGSQLQPGQIVGVNGWALSVQQAKQLQAQLGQSGLSLDTTGDAVAEIWSERPPLPQAPVYVHQAAYVGESRAQKLARLRAALASEQRQVHLISSLDDIAWLLNLRGADVPYNPVFLAFMIVTADQAQLFIDESKLSADIRAALLEDGVTCWPYEALSAQLAQWMSDDKPEAMTSEQQQLLAIGASQLSEQLSVRPVGAYERVEAPRAQDARLVIDPQRTAWAAVAPYSDRLVEELNPTQHFKSMKTPAEVAHIRHAMIKDGVALCEFFAAFEARLVDGETLSELDVDEMLLAARAQQEGFISPSFPTIAGFNANGALPHYRALPESYALIEGDGLLLIDSGGQYVDGTTDITRVVPIGQTTAQQRRDYTLVLKGMINLSMAVFPDGLPSPQLDILARTPLWQAGLDFGHGTGHGVGYFLNVHEGPQVISYHGYGRANTEMYAGMITSNEPGLYRPGQWGIRIENLICAQPAYWWFNDEQSASQSNVGQSDAVEESAFGSFLRFETLTLCPIHTACIEVSLLREDERQWLNAYHAMVRERLQDRLSLRAKAWLLRETAAI